MTGRLAASTGHATLGTPDLVPSQKQSRVGLRKVLGWEAPWQERVLYSVCATSFTFSSSPVQIGQHGSTPLRTATWRFPEEKSAKGLWSGLAANGFSPSSPCRPPI